MVNPEKVVERSLQTYFHFWKMVHISIPAQIFFFLRDQQWQWSQPRNLLYLDRLAKYNQFRHFEDFCESALKAWAFLLTWVTLTKCKIIENARKKFFFIWFCRFFIRNKTLSNTLYTGDINHNVYVDENDEDDVMCSN